MKQEEEGLTKQKVIAELIRSAHGDLKAYLPVTLQTAAKDPEFLAHLIAYNQRKGQIRDSKIALPIGSLIPGYPFTDNSLAHLALLDARNLLKACYFARDSGQKHTQAIRGLVTRWLQVREARPGWWDAVALQHRRPLKSLYALNRVKPSRYANEVLFRRLRDSADADPRHSRRLPNPAGSVFEASAQLRHMAPRDAAATIMEKRIPFLLAVSALCGKAKDPDLVLALMQQMSPAELITNMKTLEKLGVKDNPALRGALEQKLAEVATGKKKETTFKTSKAAAAVTDVKLRKRLEEVQDRQAENLAVAGDWLVIGDKSQSMTDAIEIARQIAATLARTVAGRVRLVFVNTTPHQIDVTGKTYDEILRLTQHIRADGGTSLGCGLAWALEAGFDPDGIAVVSDGAENSVPLFTPTYQRLCKKLDKEIPVYLYWMKCYMPDTWRNNPEALCLGMAAAGHDVQVLDLRSGTDFYSLPNIVQTMRANRYSMIDEIMETPLLTMEQVFADQTRRLAEAERVTA